MNTSTEIAALCEALAAAKGEFPAILKDRTAKAGQYSYNYADLASVIDALRPALAKYKLAVIQSVSTADGNKVTVVTRVCHASGQWIESDPLTIAADSPKAQSIGSAISYARRYSLGAFVGVSPEEDDDANGAQGNDAHTAPRTPAPPPSQPKKAVDYAAETKRLAGVMASCTSMKDFDVKVRSVTSSWPESEKKRLAADFTVMLERLAGEGDAEAEHHLSMRDAKSKNGKEAA